MPIVEIPRRDLGRTGLHVTMLGYGAMELRGAPRGRDVTEAQAETILNAVLDAGIVIRGGAAKGAPSEEKQEGSQWARWQRARLDDLLEGMTRMEFILRFTFSHPEMDTNIVGTINPGPPAGQRSRTATGPVASAALRRDQTSPGVCRLSLRREVDCWALFML